MKQQPKEKEKNILIRPIQDMTGSLCPQSHKSTTVVADLFLQVTGLSFKVLFSRKNNKEKIHNRVILLTKNVWQRDNTCKGV